MLSTLSAVPSPYTARLQSSPEHTRGLPKAPEAQFLPGYIQNSFMCHQANAIGGVLKPRPLWFSTKRSLRPTIVSLGTVGSVSTGRSNTPSSARCHLDFLCGFTCRLR